MHYPRVLRSVVTLAIAALLAVGSLALAQPAAAGDREPASPRTPFPEGGLTRIWTGVGGFDVSVPCLADGADGLLLMSIVGSVQLVSDNPSSPVARVAQVYEFTYTPHDASQPSYHGVVPVTGVFTPNPNYVSPTTFGFDIPITVEMHGSGGSVATINPGAIIVWVNSDGTLGGFSYGPPRDLPVAQRLVRGSDSVPRVAPAAARC